MQLEIIKNEEGVKTGYLLIPESQKEAEVRGVDKFKFFWPMGELEPRVEFVQQQIIKLLRS